MSGGAFGSAPTSTHIWMDDVNCTGFENNIDECQFRGWSVSDCSHGEDAGVECSSGSFLQRIFHFISSSCYSFILWVFYIVRQD